MIKVEVIANIELIDDFTEMLGKKYSDLHYTILPVLQGHGKKGFACGNDVWPESNFYCVMYEHEDKIDLQGLKAACDDIQSLSPLNSITMFASKVDMLSLK